MVNEMHVSVKSGYGKLFNRISFVTSKLLSALFVCQWLILAFPHGASIYQGGGAYKMKESGQLEGGHRQGTCRIWIQCIFLRIEHPNPFKDFIIIGYDMF